MHYFILTYKAFVDQQVINGQSGFYSLHPDAGTERSRRQLQAYYQQQYPGHRVTIYLYATEVEAPEYFERVPEFTGAAPMGEFDHH